MIAKGSHPVAGGHTLRCYSGASQDGCVRTGRVRTPHDARRRHDAEPTEGVEVRRPRVTVRDARPADVPVLAELWAEARRVAGVAARAMGSASESAVRTRIDRATHDPDVRLVVAVIDDVVVGLACMSREPVAPFEDATCVRVAYLHVAEAARRRGAGSALVEAAAVFAEEVGAPEIVVAVPPSLREANRFYARLALTPGVASRSVPTSVLRHKLSGDHGTPASDVVARRRRARAVLPSSRPFRSIRASGER
jgi:GNAT superfamily N-acetyltransferase